MSFGHILYQFIIGPLEVIFEAVYYYANLFLEHAGWAIAALSLAINLLLLPLYMRADKIQAEERAAEKKLERWVSHIKKTFKGDERFMMLQTYYRQNGYKPIYSLKGSLPLLLEIPFFIAAYHFLSHLDALKGASFGPIADLSQPDALLTLGGMTVHVLPVLMTVINLISGLIYGKDMPLKSMIQLYAQADALRKQADEAQAKFIECKKAADEEHKKHIEQIKSFHETDKDFAAIKNKQKAVRKKKTDAESKKAADDIFARFKSGDKLSTEDLMILQKSGYL